MVEPSYLEDFLQFDLIEKLNGEITSISAVVATLRSSHAKRPRVDVLRSMLLYLLVAKYLGLSRNIVKYVGFEERQDIRGKFMVNLLNERQGFKIILKRREEWKLCLGFLREK